MKSQSKNSKKDLTRILFLDIIFLIGMIVYIIGPIYPGYDWIGVVIIIIDLCCIYLTIKQIIKVVKKKATLVNGVVFILGVISILVMSYSSAVWWLFRS